MAKSKSSAKTTRGGYKSRRKRAIVKKEDWTLGLDVVHPKAAGIDVGNDEHYIAVPPSLDPDGQPVRCFRSFTADLHGAVAWLKQCGIQTVAMQSTGVYWLPLYEILVQEGLEVFVVNAQHTKNLPGRKTDVQECQWLLQLHVYGLLKNSFRPTDEICVLRTYWRQRQTHIAEASQCLLRIQKTLTQMNVQLANVISDLSGSTGMSILRAIVAGERDPHKLAQYRDKHIRASAEEIARSLEGNWRAELLFILKQVLDSYDTYQRKMRECDVEIEKHLHTLDSKADPTQLGPGKRISGNAPTSFDLREELFRISGVDLTRIDGISTLTAQTLIAEVGLDMSRWATEAHFSSWLGLSPDNRVSGGKVLGRGTRTVVSYATTALRQAASTLLRSKTYLGAQYRRLRTKLGAPKAITAMAHKLARLVYRMLKFGEQYVDKGMQYYEEKFREQQMKMLHRKAQELGCQVVVNPQLT